MINVSQLYLDHVQCLSCYNETYRADVSYCYIHCPVIQMLTSVWWMREVARDGARTQTDPSYVSVMMATHSTTTTDSVMVSNK